MKTATLFAPGLTVDFVDTGPTGSTGATGSTSSTGSTASPPIVGRPSFVITSPSPGRVAGTIQVAFNDTKGLGDGNADLYVDGVIRASGSIAAGVLSWDSSSDLNLPRSLQIRGTPVGGVEGESPSITIWPNNPGKDQPGVVPPPSAYPNSPYLYVSVPAIGTANQSYTRYQNGPIWAKGSQNACLFLSSNPPGTAPVWNSSIVIRRQFSGGSQTTLTERVQLILDGLPYGPWVTPVNNAATFAPDWSTVPKGSHALWARSELTQQWCEPILLEVNADGIPLTGPRPIAVCAIWFDQEYAIQPSNLPAWFVQYPGVQPKFAGDSIALPIVNAPWTSYLPSSQLYAEAISISVPTGWPRRFAKTAEGFVHTCNTMQYEHARLESLEMPIIDGPRGVGGFGHAWHCQTNPATGGVYGISTQGRLWYLHENGRIVTIAGKRKPLDKTPDRLEFEQCGNWLDGVVGFNEPWFYAHDPRDVAKPNNWLSHIVGDSWNHRLALVNNATVGRGGAADISTLVGKAGPGYLDGPADQARTYSPWGGAIGPDGKLYWSEYDADYAAIRVLDFATMVASTVWRSSAPNPTRVGKPANRVIPALVGGQIIKGIDGDFNTATGYYFQSIDFDSKGRLIIAEKFTGLGGGAIRRMDLAARTITTLYVIPFDSNTRDVTIAVNRDGTCGALDTVYGTCWGRSFVLVPNPDDSYSFKGEILRDEADGTWHAALLAGQGNQVVGLSYPTAVSCANGWLTVIGTGAECGYRIRKKIATDPVLDFNKQQRGMALYKTSWGMRHGIKGQDTLEGNGFAQISQLPKADRWALYRSGWGLGYPVTMSDANCDDVDYYICWPKGTA